MVMEWSLECAKRVYEKPGCGALSSSVRDGSWVLCHRDSHEGTSHAIRATCTVYICTMRNTAKAPRIHDHPANREQLLAMDMQDFGVLMRLLAAHLPHGKLATVPEAGDVVFWEQPKIWNRIVLEFRNQH